MTTTAFATYFIIFPDGLVTLQDKQMPKRVVRMHSGFINEENWMQRSYNEKDRMNLKAFREEGIPVGNLEGILTQHFQSPALVQFFNRLKLAIQERRALEIQCPEGTRFMLSDDNAKISMGYHFISRFSELSKNAVVSFDQD